MATLSQDEINHLLATMPSPPPYVAACPWLSATADRLVRTTTVSVGFPDVLKSTTWPGVMFCSSGLDPKTLTRYLCIVEGWTVFRFDYALNYLDQFTLTMPTSDAVITDCAYVIDPGSGANLLLCTVFQGFEGAGSLFSVRVDEAGQAAQHYRGFSNSHQLGVSVTDGTVWLYNNNFGDSISSLWSVDVSDVMAGTNASLKQWPGTQGVVQGVIPASDTNGQQYYALALSGAAPDYRLIEFDVAAPANPVTVKTGPSIGGIVTTPDGGVWLVGSLGNPSVHLLIPSYPVGGLQQSWVDPTENAQPSLQAGSVSLSQACLPLSATNLMLVPATPQPTNGFMEVWRVGLGVFDQPALGFPTYSGNQLVAYQTISSSLVQGSLGPINPADDDIRNHYGNLTAAQAGGYLTAVQGLDPPSGFSDPAAWTEVQNQLWVELFSLVSTLSFCEAMTDLTMLKNAVNQVALTYVSNLVVIPDTAKPIDDSAGVFNGLTITAGVVSGAGDILTAVGLILGTAAVALPVGIAAAGAAAVAMILSTLAAESAGWSITVDDYNYPISARLSDVESRVGPVFAATVAAIGTLAQQAAKDFGLLTTVGGLYRGGSWLANPPTEIDPAVAATELPYYYNSCVAAYLQAFLPLVAAVQVDARKLWSGGVVQGPWITVTYDGQTHSGQTLQQGNAKEGGTLGQNVNPVIDQLVSANQLTYEDVFFTWGMPTTPFWL